MGYYDNEDGSSPHDAVIWAGAVLSCFPAIPLFFLFIASLFLARKYGDPARHGAGWTKGLLPMLFVSCLFVGISGASMNLLWSNELFTGIYFPIYVSAYVKVLTELVGFMALVETGLGFLYVRSRGYVTIDPKNKAAGADEAKPVTPKLNRTIRIAAYAFAFVMLALETATMIVNVKGYADLRSLNDEYYEDVREAIANDTDRSDVEYDYVAEGRIARQFIASVRVDAAYIILMWLASLLLLGFSFFVVSQTRGSLFRNATHIFAAATVVWFVRWIWLFVFYAHWILPMSGVYQPLALVIVDPLLDHWLFLIVAILLFAIFIRKRNGIWSHVRPWMYRL